MMSEAFTYVFTSGGIGITHDDVTMESIAFAFRRKLAVHTQFLERLSRYYPADAAEELKRAAMLPDGAQLIIDDGMHVVQVHNVFVLPGVPQFLKAKLSVIRPRLKHTPIWQAELRLSIREETIAATMAQIDRSYPEVEIGSYPRFDSGADYKVLVVFEGPNRGKVVRAFEQMLTVVDPSWVVSKEEPALVQSLGA